MSQLYKILGAVAVLAIALVFVIGFNPTAGMQIKGVDITCAIEVRGSCIPSTEFWASYRLLAPRNADAARLRAMGLRKITAEGLYERWLLNEDAKRLGITVSDDELTAELASGRAHVSLPADKMRQVGYSLGLTPFGDGELFRMLDVRNRQTKKFEKKRYDREVRAITKLSEQDYRNHQKQELIAGRLRDLVKARVRVGENEAFEQFSREKSTRKIDYLRFDRRFYAELLVDTSDKAVQAWADQNKDEVDRVWESRKAQILPECRLTRHVLAKVKPGASDAEAEKAAAKAKIERAQALLKKGDRFADVARRLSDDTSAPRGGELGCVAKGKMVKPFEDKVFELKAGEISEPVETEYGFHLIQVEQIAKDADAEKIGRMQIARELSLTHEAERLAAEAAKQVLASVATGRPMKEALDSYLATLAPQGEGDGKKKEKTAEKKIAPEGEGPPAEGKKGDEIKENEPLTLETHPHRPTVETSLAFNASGDPLPSVKSGTDAARIAFELAKVGDVPKDVVPLDNGYAVIQLKEVTPVTQEQWDKERDYYVSSMRAAKQNDALIGYVRRLRATLGSEVKYDLTLTTESKEREGDAEPIPEEGE